MTNPENHPDWNQLAALADSGSDGAPPGLLEHLATCPQCMAAWSAAVEQRHRDLADVGMQPANSDGGARRISRISRRRNLTWGLGGLAAAAVLLVVLLPRGDHGQGLTPDESAVLQRLGDMSHVGLVYPRIDQLDDVSRTEYRSGGQVGHEVDLSEWEARFADQPTNTGAAFWLAAGHLGNGRLDDADDVLRRALSLSPEASELRHLAAIVAYRRNDLATASRDLDLILGQDPGNHLAAFNRAVIAMEAGDSTGVCGILHDVMTETESHLVRQRAQQLSHDIGCR